MHRFFALAVLGTTMAWSAPRLNAQVVAPGRNFTLPRVSVSIAYSPVESNAGPGKCGCFFMDGGSAEAMIHAYRGISGVVDVTGEHTAQINDTKQPLSMLLVTGGLRISYRFGGDRFWRYTPFAQGLVGEARGFDSAFPDKAGFIDNSASSFALLAGGGLDIRFHRHIAFRAIQADYGLTHLPNNAGNQQNLIRISSGVIFRIW